VRIAEGKPLKINYRICLAFPASNKMDAHCALRNPVTMGKELPYTLKQTVCKEGLSIENLRRNVNTGLKRD
jgi:hypothetical protein